MLDLINNFLTNNSKNKLAIIQIHNGSQQPLNSNLEKLLNNMTIAYFKDIKLDNAIPIDLVDLQNHFIDFDRKFNGDKYLDTKFISDVKKMNLTYSIKMQILKDTIIINLLVNILCVKLIASILHALHTFCNMFPYNYDGLTINICLDDNHRDINWQLPRDELFDYVKKKSLAFNVSGVTRRDKRVIDLTKQEEIIKLMYHELVHYIGLDSLLVGQYVNFGFAITKPNVNVSEAYTEFMAILLNSAYISIRLMTKKNNLNCCTYDMYKRLISLETKYSIYLTANILKLYGYNHQTFRNFFDGIGQKNYSPIYIWEYVILRSQLLINLNKITDDIVADWRVINSHKIIDLMRINNKMIDEIQLVMAYTNPIDNLSYTAIELDWNLIN